MRPVANPPPDLAAHAARLLPHATVVKPDGPGPFPVVLQLHGCGGIKLMQTRYAEAARSVGVAAVIVDSLAPRGISLLQAELSVCSGLKLRGAERAADLTAMLHWVRAQPWADPNRLAAAGWSHGGWAIMEALAEAGASAEPSGHPAAALRRVLLTYPYCGPLAARTHRHGWGALTPKVFACLAGRDAVVGRIAPRRALARLEADGVKLERLELPDATHGFDDDQAVDPRTRYRHDLAARALEAYGDVLRRLVAA